MTTTPIPVNRSPMNDELTNVVQNDESPTKVQVLEEISTRLRERLDSTKSTVDSDDLNSVISSLQATLAAKDHVGEHGTIARLQLVKALLIRYGIYAWIEDLDACFAHLEGVESIADFTDTHRNDESVLKEIESVNRSIEKCRNSLNVDILNTVISTTEEALSLYPGGASDLQEVIILIGQGNTFIMKYLSSRTLDDLEQASQSFTQAENSCALEGHLAHGYICLVSLASIELLRFMDHDEIEGLLRSRAWLKKANKVDQEGRDPSDIGAKLAENSIDDVQLQEAINLLTKSLQHRAHPHPRRFSSLSHLTSALYKRYQQRGALQDIEKCIVLYREALELRPTSQPGHLLSLNNLAATLSVRFKETGSLQDLEESIVLQTKALDLTPTSHPDYSSLLNNLAAALYVRFEQKGALQDLEECIALHREALKRAPAPHPDRPISLNNLADALSARFEQKGSYPDLEECIMLHKEALSLLPIPHPERSISLNNVAANLLTRFDYKGAFHDLEECIMIHREALDLQPAPHPIRSTTLSNLATALSTRHRKKGAIQDLDESISLLREALDLRAAPHRDRSWSLNSLAAALSTRFEQEDGNSQDLEECIILLREAVDLRPATHPNRSRALNNLAAALSTRFVKKGGFQDIEECITLHQEALDLRPAPHPERSMSLNNLADSLSIRYEQRLNRAFRLRYLPHSLSTHNLDSTTYPPFNPSNDTDIENAISYYKEASQYQTGSLIDRLMFSENWARCARTHHPESAQALDAYHYAMQLLPLVASLDLTLQQRQDVLQHSQMLVGKAARCAMDANQHDVAITFLSSGRSIFWSRALQLRTPVDQLAMTHPSLAEKYITTSRQLENASYDDLHSTAGANTSLYGLADQQQQIINEIKTIPGFEEFLEPPSFSVLQGAADNGPIVMLNASESGCDALILHRKGLVKRIPLPDVYLEELEELNSVVNMVLEAGMRRSVDVSSDATEIFRAWLGRDMGRVSANVSNEDTFRSALECLWIKVVRLVVQALQLEKTDSSNRLWWCPTGPFASLPIHAAGIYSEDNQPIDCLFQYAVSSYCTSPQDLLHPVPSISSAFKMTVIVEPEAPGAPALPATRQELTKIEKHVPDRQHLIKHVGSKSVPNQITKLVTDIQQSSFVHFGCHGTQNLKNPLDSYLLLSGGKLTMSRIIRECKVPEGALAYLSACETAKGDEARPDESLNLVATMMFAGFRSVVGTMWTILDDDAPVVAGVFYRHLFRNGKETPPDVRDAAFGLHLATTKLRDQGKSFYSWVPYVHYGI